MNIEESIRSISKLDPGDTKALRDAIWVLSGCIEKLELRLHALEGEFRRGDE